MKRILFLLLVWAAASGHAQTRSGSPLSPSYSPDPPYTEAAWNARIKGTVFVSILVGTDGCARNLKVTKGLGYGLDESAVAAIQRWRFRKPRKPSRMMVEVNFTFYSDTVSPSTVPITGPKCSEMSKKQGVERR